MRKAFGARLEALLVTALIGFWATYSGAVGIFNYGVSADALDALFGGVLVDVFQVVYLVAGLALLIGMARGRGDIEGFGLAIVVASVAVRQIALAYVLWGIDAATVVNSLAFNSALVVVCLIRLRMIKKRRVIVIVEPGGAAP